MRGGFAFLLAAFVLALNPIAARAKTANPKDVATISSCLDAVDKKTPTQEADEASCLMKIALPCMGGDEASVSDRRKLDCLERERMAWDKLLNDSYKTTMAALDTDQQTKLRDVQRAWVTMRDSTCNFWYDYFQGTMANPMIAYVTTAKPRGGLFTSGSLRSTCRSGNSREGKRPFFRSKGPSARQMDCRLSDCQKQTPVRAQ